MGHVSTDAPVGINQTDMHPWEKVQKVMESSEPFAAALVAKPLELQTWLSLQAHYGQTQKSIAKDVGCSKQVEFMRLSGWTERDTMKKALDYIRNAQTSFRVLRVLRCALKVP